MPILRDFERRLGGLVEGLFSKAFRSGVQPVEIAKLIMKEMEAGQSVGVSEVWAPNRFVLSLSPEDSARYEQAEDAIVSRAATRDPRVGRRARLGLVGPPEVTFEVDERLKRGDLACVASLVEGEDEVGAAAPARSVVIHEDGDERTVALASDTLTIGRLADCDIVARRQGRLAEARAAEATATSGRSPTWDRRTGRGSTVRRSSRASSPTGTRSRSARPCSSSGGSRRACSPITITPFALSALKYGLFALLFLFIWRSMRWVVRGLSVAERVGRRGTRRPTAARRRRRSRRDRPRCS